MDLDRPGAAPAGPGAAARAQPQLDVRMEDHPAHFWLVTAVALVNVALGAAVGEAARRHRDARLLLVSLTFVASAGFLGLHALATPRVLLPGRTAGFVVATPVGLFLGACFGATSSLRLEGTVGAAEEATREREGIEQELRVAQRIQRQFLPPGVPELAGWRIATHYRPARAVGGDITLVTLERTATPPASPASVRSPKTAPLREVRGELQSHESEKLLRSTDLGEERGGHGTASMDRQGERPDRRRPPSRQ